ncbi:hypothetical protein AB3S75_029153 [Citrus x aurantiifolia]
MKSPRRIVDTSSLQLFLTVVFLVPQLFGLKDDVVVKKIIVQMTGWKLSQESPGFCESGRICCCPTDVFNILLLYRVESKAAPTAC